MTADQKMAHILYIDFGNEESVPLGRIKQLATKIQPFCPCVSKYPFKFSYLFILIYHNIYVYLFIYLFIFMNNV